jgi:hypothetical protein
VQAIALGEKTQEQIATDFGESQESLHGLPRLAKYSVGGTPRSDDSTTFWSGRDACENVAQCRS